MSMVNNYMYGSRERGQSQNQSHPLDILAQARQGGGANNVQLDLSHLVSSSQSSGSPNSMNNVLSILPTQSQLQSASAKQIHFQSGSANPTALISHQQQQQQSQQLGRAKKKEDVLKTPLSLLNEICSKAKTVANFTIEENGPVHSRVYQCTVKVEAHGYSCEATANGKTKKDAKQDAAKALLIQMDGDVEKYLIPKVAKEEAPAPVIEVDPDVPGNPVGELNDLCTKLKRLPPEYEDVAEFGKPHERVYTISCKLGSNIKESGRGRSKKSAKKVAAHRVHKRVLELLAQGSEGAALLKEEDNLIERLSTLALVSKQDAKKISDGWKLNDWMEEMKSRSGPKFDQFKDPSQSRVATGDPMKLLKEISEEQKFKLEFTELQDPRNTEVKTYMIGVSSGSQPITVLMGSADSKTQAKKVAAENFIEMLRLVLLSK